jgi:hypothetical protein
MLNAYDPNVALSAADWLALDEDERIELVSSYHRRRKIKLPNSQLHAVIHVVVENQLAMGESVVIATLASFKPRGWIDTTRCMPSGLFSRSICTS